MSKQRNRKSVKIKLKRKRRNRNKIKHITEEITLYTTNFPVNGLNSKDSQFSPRYLGTSIAKKQNNETSVGLYKNVVAKGAMNAP